MLTRIITAIFLIIAVILWLFVASYPIFTIGALFVYMLAAYEMGPLLGFKSKVPFVVVALIAATLCFYIAPPGLYIETQIPNVVKYIICSSLIYWCIAFFLVRSYPNNSSWLNNKILGSIAALFMLVPFLLSLLVLRAENYSQNVHTGAYLVLAIMALVWACDSGAYFTGRALGKTPLIVNVSPKKTREGLLGGIVLAILCLLVCDHLGLYGSYVNTNGALMISGFACIIFSVLGDLVESMFKRKVNLKDSGKIFPGHGGMLDRIDSQLAALPVFLSLYYLISGQIF